MQFVGETVTGIVWKGKEERSPKIGSMQSCCCSAGPLPVPTVLEDQGKQIGGVTERCRITASALKPQRIGRGVWD